MLNLDSMDACVLAVRGEQAQNHMLFGEAKDAAFHLGEDVAEKGEILIDYKVHDRIMSDPQFQDLNFDRRVSGVNSLA